MKAADQKYGSLWTREETTLCFYLYCQIPFSRTNKSNPEVVKLAELLGRTVGSIVRKLGNFGAVDERLRAMNIRGLTNFAKLDKQIFDEYIGDPERLVADSTRILARSNKATGKEPNAAAEYEAERDVIANFAKLSTLPTATRRLVNIRLRQAFFRRSVLSNYGGRCCVSRIDIPELLVASHIMPWSVNEKARTDPQNGLLLSALHDRAFDIGLFTVTTDLRVRLSSRILNADSIALKSAFRDFEGKEIDAPSKFYPNREYLEWHHKNRFIA